MIGTLQQPIPPLERFGLRDLRPEGVDRNFGRVERGVADLVGTLNRALHMGAFTCAAAASTTVTDTAVYVTATSVILLMPTNAAAATLMSSAASLYVSARTARTSFVVTTANGAAAAGTETFAYLLVG